jgi:hypothetical protein
MGRWHTLNSKSRKFSPITSTAHFCTSALTKIPLPSPTSLCNPTRISTNLLDCLSNEEVSKTFFCRPGFIIDVKSLQFSWALIILSPTSVAITECGIFF